MTSDPTHQVPETIQREQTLPNGAAFKSQGRPTGAAAVELVRRDQIFADERNPRIHSPKHIRQIQKSIQTFGFLVPLLLDANNKILAGHGRLLAAQRLGLAEVPAIRLHHLTPEQARAFAIADNRLTETGAWNDKLLGEIFLELSALELDFELEVTGFTTGEIDFRIEGLSGDQEAGGTRPAAQDKDDVVEAPDPAATPVTAPGDLWCLGRHRILCGNSCEAATYKALLGEHKGAIVVADVPYNKRIQGHVSGNGKTQHREFPMASGEMTTQEFTQFLRTVMEHLCAHTQDGSIHYLFIDWSGLPAMLAAGTGVYAELKNLVVWNKDKAGMGSFYSPRCSCTMRTARSRTSGENLVGLFMAPFS